MAQRAEEGGVRGLGGEGRGWGLWGGGALRRRRAAPPRRPQPPARSLRGGRLHLRPLPSLPRRQDGDTALDDAKKKKHTQVIALLENAAAVAAQVGPSTCRHGKSEATAGAVSQGVDAQYACLSTCSPSGYSKYGHGAHQPWPCL